MHGLGFTPFAIFFELDLAFYFTLVLAGPVIDPFAFRAGEFYESIL
jgi:hypothetical protein